MTQVLRPTIADSVAAAVIFVFRGYVPVELRLAVEREKLRLERLIRNLLESSARARRSRSKSSRRAARSVSPAASSTSASTASIAIEGGGFAILDYKSGEPRAPRWNGEPVRDPQLLAYLMAERGRNVQALANVSLVNGRATFSGKARTRACCPV